MKPYSKLILGVCCAFFFCRLAYPQSGATLIAESGYKKIDVELNQVYNELIEVLKVKGSKDDIVKAQRAWIAFRESDAKARAGITSDGGSAYSMDYLANMTEMTQQRVEQLKAILKVVKFKG